MIDFATVKSLEIPEGKVTKIADASGRVLWSAVKLANLTITSFWDGMDGDSARITITSPSPFAPNPDEPNNKVTSWTAYVYDLFDQQNRTIKIPIGSTIECYITRDKGNADSYIKLNGVNVTTGEGTYVYTVTGDATIDVSEEYIQGDFGVISITGAVTYISFTINGEAYQAIEGMTWSGWFTSDYNTTGETKGDVKNIKDANGNEVSLDAVIVGGTVYEITIAHTYSIDYALNGGSLSGSYPTTYTNIFSAVLPTPTRTGYDFVGWYDNPNFSGNAVTEIPAGSNGNKTFYAKWNVKYYTVTLDRTSNTGDHAVAWVNGIGYRDDATLSLPHGTIIRFVASGGSEARIKIGSTNVGTVSGSEVIYEHTLTQNISVGLTTVFIYNYGYIVIHNK